MVVLYILDQPYWAKDIIFLISEHEQLGVAAWLEAYHGNARGHGALDAGTLSARAGQIQVDRNPQSRYIITLCFFSYCLFIDDQIIM